MPTLDDLIARADEMAAAARRLASDLRAFKRLQSQSGKAPALKQGDGKLSEEGVRVVNAGLRAGRSASEIARSVGISVPAVLYRKRMYEASLKRGGGA